MIYVCDAIMGSGKTSAAINYLKTHKTERVIYITPFLDEVDRILNKCERIAIHTPSAVKARKDCGEYAKRKDFERLVRQGKNIATTHSLFREISPEVTEIIKSQGYTLIVDENLEEIQMSSDEDQRTVNGFDLPSMEIFERAGDIIKTVNYSSELVDVVTYTKNKDCQKKEISGPIGELYKQLDSRILKAYIYKENGEQTGVSFYWMVRPELFTSFKDAIIMTYKFEGQGLYNIFKLFDITYKNIGIKKTTKGFFFDFSGVANTYVPEYTKNIHNLIHILDDEKLNGIGNDENALSVGWFNREMAAEEKGKRHLIKQLRNNITNCYNHKWKGSSGTLGSKDNARRLWAAFMAFKESLSGKGYSKNFLSFNAKATNDYRGAEYLVYAVNLYYFLPVKFMYNALGIEINDELYALSTMIQWIWRSAIRDGKPVYLYLPSSRMRRILINWMNEISGGGEENRCTSVGTASGMIPISVTRDMAV